MGPWRWAFFCGVVVAGCTWGLAAWMFLYTTELLPRCLGDVSGDKHADLVGFGSSGAYVSLSLW